MDDMSKLQALFGGTFDPIHYGHLKPVEILANQIGLSRVIIMPNNVPPHRPQPEATSEQRKLMVELAIAAPGAAVPKPVAFRCSNNREPFTMTYYNDIDPQAAVMMLGNDQAIVFPQPAASGAKYGRVGVEYWEHQGEASVDFFGNKLSCTPVK